MKTSALYTASACCAAAWGSFGGKYAFAQSATGNGNILIFINQFGGNDPLNSFTVPRNNSAYYDRRPGLAIDEAQVLSLDNNTGLNPVLSELYQLYNAGDLAVIHGVGDPLGTRSHFTSQFVQSTGITGEVPEGSQVDSQIALDKRGWIGRMGDLYLSDVPYNTVGIGVGSRTDFTSTRPTNRPLVTSRLSSMGFNDDYTGSSDNAFRRYTRRRLLGIDRNLNERGKSARRSQEGLYSGVDQVRDAIDAYTGPDYPGNSLGQYLRDVAILLEAGFGTALAYGGIGGWDTHSNQRGGHDAGLARIDQAVAAFAADVKRLGKWNKVTIVIFTEFGRKTFENASVGTDHGKGGAMVMIGGSVQGGVYGAAPSDAMIRNQSWLDQDIDWRAPLSRAINWLGYDPGPVFPEPFENANLNLLG